MRKTKLLLAIVAMGITFSSFAQVKIGTNPTVIGANSNLEVEAANNKKVIVNKDVGTVVIENTPPGQVTDRLLTVDAAGNVRAITPPNTYVLAKQNAAVSLPNSPNFTVRTKIPLGNEITDTNNAWNAATSTFTAPEDGYYLINFNYMVDFNRSAIYSATAGGTGGGGFMQIGLLKTAGTSTGTVSPNNGYYFSSFQGEDSGLTGANVITPNHGGGVFNMVLYFKVGEQFIPQVAQANARAIALPSPFNSPTFSSDNFISITKL